MANLELTFRFARLKLSEGIYDGHDYLPLRFHTWMMKMADKIAVMLAYSGEKLVGLAACSVVDEGRTAVRLSARTLPEFRGRGVYRQLLQVMKEFTRSHFPNVRRERFTALDSFPLLTKLAQLEILRSYVEKKTLRSHQVPTANNTDQIEPCTKEYLCNVIFSRPVVQELFPDNIIVVDFFPIEPLRSNIDYLQQENDVYFAVEKCSDGAFPRSVSFGVLSPRVKFIHWNVTVYTSDPALYEAHLLHQFKRACEVIKGDFIFDSFHDKNLTNYGRRVFKECLQLTLDEECSNMSLSVYEPE